MVKLRQIAALYKNLKRSAIKESSFFKRLFAIISLKLERFNFRI